MSKMVKCNSQLLIDGHLAIVRTIIKDRIIFYGADKIVKAIRSNTKVGSEDFRPIDLVIMKEKIKLVGVFADRLSVCKVVL